MLCRLAFLERSKCNSTTGSLDCVHRMRTVPQRGAGGMTPRAVSRLVLPPSHSSEVVAASRFRRRWGARAAPGTPTATIAVVVGGNRISIAGAKPPLRLVSGGALISLCFNLCNYRMPGKVTGANRPEV